MTNLLFAPPALGTVLSLTGLPGGSNKIHDRSPYGNHGTITGATWKRLPSGLWCLSFDGGDDYVDCGNDASLAVTGALTIEAFIKPTAVNAWYSIVSMYENNTDNGYQFYLHTDGKLRFKTELGGISQVSASSLTAGVWQYVAVTFNCSADELKFYIDGGLDVTRTEATDLIATTQNLHIGKDNRAGLYYFNGDIGMLRIYNRALSSLEIQNHFDREKRLFGVW